MEYKACKLSKAEKIAIADRYVSGESLVSLYKETGIAKGTIKNICKSMGIPVRPPAEAQVRYGINEAYFDSITEGSAYWAGFIFADGHIRSKGSGQRGIKIGLSSKDTNHLEKFKDSLDFLGTIREYEPAAGCYPSAYKIVELVFTSDRIVSGLESLGMVGDRIPIEAIDSDRHFWRGMVDGDGSVGVSKGKPVITLCGKIGILEKFLKYLNDSGVATRRVPICRGQIHQLVFSGPIAGRIIGNLYSNNTIALDRKNAVALNLQVPV